LAMGLFQRGSVSLDSSRRLVSPRNSQ
jgi:hypothetical protein